MILSLIWAMTENRVIGQGGDLPWHLPDDLKFFKAKTTGRSLIMGRKTFDSIGRRPLPRRRNIVLSREANLDVPGVETVRHLESALERCAGEEEVFVVGGSEIYRLALPKADRLYLTLIHAELPGDVFFPDFDLEDWQLLEEDRRPADERHAHAFSFRRYERRPAGPS